jgi:hypothetical protein
LPKIFSSDFRGVNAIIPVTTVIMAEYKNADAWSSFSITEIPDDISIRIPSMISTRLKILAIILKLTI